MTATPVRIGTRGSALARVQAEIVQERLANVGVAAELSVIVTDGDRRSADTPWGEGAFVGAIEAALLAGDIDVAVHSAKDVPTDEDPRLTIAAFLPRADARDVVVLPIGHRAASLDDLPHGTRIGTDSPRRSAFLRAARPDLAPHPLHGNVDTRLGRLDAGETDALVLAAAGLERLGRADRISFVLPIGTVPPAPGQGALAVQVRSEDAIVRAAVAALDDPATRRAVTAERALLAASGGGCRAPLGAYGRVAGDGALELLGGYAREGGSVRAVVQRAAPAVSPEQGDTALVDRVLADIAAAAGAKASARGEPRVLVTRAAAQAAATALALVDAGLAPVSVPAITIEPASADELDAAVGKLSDFHWVVVTSANAHAPLVAAGHRVGSPVNGDGPIWAAVGGTTARALRAAGITVGVEGDGSSGVALADRLPIAPGDRVLVPVGDRADPVLSTRLRDRGATVVTVVAYRTTLAPSNSETALREALAAGPPAAVLFTSGSTARGLAELATRVGADVSVRAIPVACIGAPTAASAASLGFDVVAVAASPDLAEVAAAARRAATDTRSHRLPPVPLESS